MKSARGCGVDIPPSGIFSSSLEWMYRMVGNGGRFCGVVASSHFTASTKTILGALVPRPAKSEAGRNPKRNIRIALSFLHDLDNLFLPSHLMIIRHYSRDDIWIISTDLCA